MSRRFDAAWGEAEHAEHEALIREVLNEAEGNAARAALYREKIADGIQALRPWARDVEERVLTNGFEAFWKRVSRQGVALVVRDGKASRKPRTWSLPRVSEDGERYTQDALIDAFTREDIMHKREEALKMLRSWDGTLTLYSALLDFLDKAGADDIATAEAILGMSVDEWLEGRAA